MIQEKLRETLDRAGVRYEVHDHAEAFTAPEIAALEHVPGRELAKAVILKVDESFAMAVLNANGLVDLERVRQALGARSVRLANEAELAPLFPGCETGAMPPFGNLFGLEVFVDPVLEEDELLTFNAGNHRQTVRMRYDDWKELVRPRVLALAREAARKAA